MNKEKTDKASKRIKHEIWCDMTQGIFVLIIGAICCWTICVMAMALNI